MGTKPVKALNSVKVRDFEQRPTICQSMLVSFQNLKPDVVDLTLFRYAFSTGVNKT